MYILSVSFSLPQTAREREISNFLFLTLNFVVIALSFSQRFNSLKWFGILLRSLSFDDGALNAMLTACNMQLIVCI